MLTVTLPSGKRYTFAARNAARARALADRTGGTLTTDRPAWAAAPMARDVAYGATVCPHGDDARYCERGACDEGWDW